LYLVGVLAVSSAQARQGAPAPAVFESVSAERAIGLVENGRVHPIDTRPLGKFLAGHVPGAVHLDDERLRASTGGRPAAYLADDALALAFAEAGVTLDRPVLVYSDGEDPLSATMTAYCLLRAGHPRVLLLDGGFEAWRGNGKTTQAYATVSPAPWSPASRAGTMSASLSDAEKASELGLGRLVDARPAKVYRGEGKSWMRNGHIPGASNLDWTSLVRADNQSLLKPRKEIEKLVADAGLRKEDPIIVYCGTGREATLLYLALAHVLEWPRVRLYEGSWTEWCSVEGLPVATGDEDTVEVHADGDMLISAQPTEELLRRLADEGVTLVINCRTGRETSGVGFNEGALAKRLGIRYAEIPMGGTEGYDPEQVRALEKILSEQASAGGKTLMHCASGGRAAQLWTAYLVRNRGMTPEQAQAHAQRTGMLRPTTLELLTRE